MVQGEAPDRMVQGKALDRMVQGRLRGLPPILRIRYTARIRSKSSRNLPPAPVLRWWVASTSARRNLILPRSWVVVSYRPFAPVLDLPAPIWSSSTTTLPLPNFAISNGRSTLKLSIARN